MLAIKTVGSVLRDIRKSRGLTQQELSDVAGVGTNSITRYERGRHAPPLDAFILLADALETTPSEILRRAEERDAETHERS